MLLTKVFYISPVISGMSLQLSSICFFAKNKIMMIIQQELEVVHDGLNGKDQIVSYSLTKCQPYQCSELRRVVKKSYCRNKTFFVMIVSQ